MRVSLIYLENCSLPMFIPWVFPSPITIDINYLMWGGWSSEENPCKIPKVWYTNFLMQVLCDRGVPQQSNKLYIQVINFIKIIECDSFVFICWHALQYNPNVSIVIFLDSITPYKNPRVQCKQTNKENERKA
jgi:hypothetical protein